MMCREAFFSLWSGQGESAYFIEGGQIFDFDAYAPEQREVMIAEAIAKLNGYHYKPDDDEMDE